MIEEKEIEGRAQEEVKLHRSNRSCGGGLIWGVALTLLGVAFLLDHMGYINIDHVWRFWPLILIVAGASHITAPERRFWGIILIAAGVVLQLNQLGMTHFGWGDLWPIILIAVGLMILWGSIEARTRPGAPASSSGDPRTTLNENVVFGGIERRVTTQNFEGGRVTAVFGGVELDLRDANMQADEATLEVNAVFGGIEIRLPETWHVAFRGTPVFGGLTDKTRTSTREVPEGAKSKVLYLTGSVIFGGVDVKN
jgi:predicted membrane protein